MKTKFVTFISIILLSTSVFAQYVDLGLPSGTQWKNTNEPGYCSLDVALEKYGEAIPTRMQLNELRTKCQWIWAGNGYKVIGPNGNHIILPAKGRLMVDPFTNELQEVYIGTMGCYPSRSRNEKFRYNIYTLNFISKSVYENEELDADKFTFRLVKK